MRLVPSRYTSRNFFCFTYRIYPVESFEASYSCIRGRRLPCAVSAAYTGQPARWRRRSNNGRAGRSFGSEQGGKHSPFICLYGRHDPDYSFLWPPNIDRWRGAAARPSRRARQIDCWRDGRRRAGRRNSWSPVRTAAVSAVPAAYLQRTT